MAQNSQIKRTYHFEAGHWLPLVHEGHKCKRPHGHNYRMDVFVHGPVNPIGFVVDFWDLDKVVGPLIEKVDHRMLNEVEGLENPTAENIAQWFLDHITNEVADDGLELSVEVFETQDCSARACGQ